MEKWGPVILIFLFFEHTVLQPTSHPALSQPIPFLADNPIHKNPAGYPPASETSPSTGDFSKSKANHSPGWEKMDLSRRQVVSALN